jgi:type IV secretion system protein VirD4
MNRVFQLIFWALFILLFYKIGASATWPPSPNSKHLFVMLFVVGAMVWFGGPRLVTSLMASSAARTTDLKKHGYKPYREPNRLALEKFGATAEERTKGIDKFFDEKTGTISETILKQYGNGYRVGKATITRPLAAMSGREREALRAAYHLANIGEMGGSNEAKKGASNTNNFYLSRVPLIFGEGKALITRTSGCRKDGGQCTDEEAIKGSMEQSVEGAISLVLSHVAGAAERQPDHPVIKRLKERLMGGGTQSLSSTEGFTGTAVDVAKPALILGDAEDTGEPVRFDGEGSAITVAPPGSGKTQCHVFPTLLTWKGPAVVLDVKGEIYAGTSKWRAEHVGPVYKFSPLDPNNSHQYNPLTLVRSDPDYLWEDSRFLADMMMVPTEAKDPFWENRARDVLTAAIARACLTDDPAKRSLDRVIDVFHGLGWDEFIRDLQARVDIRSMTRAGSSLSDMEQKTRDGVLQTGLSSLSAWDGDRIARATARSDWSPLDLRAGSNPTVYICLKPNEVESYISVLRVFIAQHIRALTSELPPHGAAPILFMLDELPRLRQMPPVEEALEIGRQYGIKLWMFTQSVGQMQNAYPNGDGMIGSCAIRMYMNPSLHDETAQKISDDIGFQESVLDSTRQKIVEPAVLAGPEYKDYVIVMAAGTKPFRVKKHFAWQDSELSGRMGSL